jgi:hypothetical protein
LATIPAWSTVHFRTLNLSPDVYQWNGGGSSEEELEGNREETVGKKKTTKDKITIMGQNHKNYQNSG